MRTTFILTLWTILVLCSGCQATQSPPAELRVFVLGSVARPGVVAYSNGMTPAQAVEEAGGEISARRGNNVHLLRDRNSEDRAVWKLSEIDMRQAALKPGDVLIVNPRIYTTSEDLGLDSDGKRSQQHGRQISSEGAPSAPPNESSP